MKKKPRRPTPIERPHDARANKPVQPHYHFLDREHPPSYRHTEMQNLIRAITARENRLVLRLPDLGTSNLLRMLVMQPELIERQVIFVYLTCEELSDGLDQENFFEAIAQELAAQSLGGKPKAGVRGYARLKELLTQLRPDPERRIAIIVNNGDSLLSTADQSFYRKLKVLSDYQKGVCYFFVADPRLEHIVDPEKLLFPGRKLSVGPLNEQDCRHAVTEEGQRLNVDFDAEAQEKLVRLTGGAPGLLRGVSSAAVEEELDLAQPEAVLAAHLSEAEGVRERCQKLWKALDPSYQAALQFIACGQTADVGAPALAWLRRFGLVAETDARAAHAVRYRIFSPIFERFVAAQQLITRMVIDRTELDAGMEIVVAARLFRGTKELHVHPATLRFIACLARAHKICTKADIEKYVFRTKEASDPRRIETLCKEARQVLGKKAIKTCYGIGYEFVGVLEVVGLR